MIKNILMEKLFLNGKIINFIILDFVYQQEKIPQQMFKLQYLEQIDYNLTIII